MHFETDEDVLDWIRERVDEFVGKLQSDHSQDPRAQRLFDKLNDVRLLDPEESSPRQGSWRNGKFKHSLGTLYVAPRDPSGAFRTTSSLLKTVVHELGHGTRRKYAGEGSHSPQWKQTWLWFLGIATNDLKWPVDIKCAECTRYGLCDQNACPKCNWLQNLCKPYVGGHKG